MSKYKPIITLGDFTNKAYEKGALAASEWLGSWSQGSFEDDTENPFEEFTQEFFDWEEGYWQTLDDSRYNC